MPNNDSYENEEILNTYLFFHYGEIEKQIPNRLTKDTVSKQTFDFLSQAANYPSATVNSMIDTKSLNKNSKGLDIGCSVGRSTFELAKYCSSCIGIDYSKSFIKAANKIQSGEKIKINYNLEGSHNISTSLPSDNFLEHLDKCSFKHGDAQAIDLTTAFEVIHAANLLCRLQNPKLFLNECVRLLSPGGQLIISSPYSWLKEFTPKENWIGGTKDTHSSDALKEFFLNLNFKIEKELELPFLIREHDRKFLLSFGHAIRFRAPSN